MIPFRRSTISAFTPSRILSHPIGHASISQQGRRLWRSAPSSAAASKAKASKSTILLGALPTHLTDAQGNKVGSLPPDPGRRVKTASKGKTSKTSKGKTSLSSSMGAEAAETVQAVSETGYRAAVTRGEVPDSPLAEQVYENWKRFPDAVLLTRVGKFYESYFAPAVELSSLLSLKLAYKRYAGGNFPFSGFPVHQLDKYLKILVQDLDRTVVLVEEYDEEGRKEGLDPMRKVASGADLKDRRVGRVVTPGTLVEESWVSGDESRYLLAVSVDTEGGGQEDCRVSLAYTDPSTGEFFLRETTVEYIEDEVARIAPSEIVLDAGLKEAWYSGEQLVGAMTPVNDLFQLFRVLGVHVSFAVAEHGATIRSPPSAPAAPQSLEMQAISLLRRHLEYALRDSMPELSSPNKQSSSKTMLIDAATLGALEIRHAIRPGGMSNASDSFGRSSPLSSRGTLLSTMSQTTTPSGHRLLVRTLTAPSTDITLINSRLDLVEALVGQEELRTDLRDMIRGVGDVMRIVQRFKGRRGTGRDAWDLALWVRSFERVLGRIKRDSAVEGAGGRLQAFIKSVKPLADLAELVEGTIDEAAVMKQGLSEGDVDDEDMELQAGDAMLAGSKARKGESKKQRIEREKAENDVNQWWMKPHFTEELKSMHEELTGMKAGRAKMERDLRKKLGVEKLYLTKHRNVFVMSVSDRLDYAKIDKLRQFANIFEGKASKHYAYNSWTQLGGQTDKLMEDMLFAQRRAFDLLRDQIVARAEDVQHNAELMDELDLALSFAQTAADLGYVRPILDESTDLEITNGRHPTVETSLLNHSRSFTPNSTSMTPSSHLHIITGPNQGGKSTLLRQTAVIAILAQAGSFVPAERVRMGIVDRVFSRIGARDDLFRDRSTFMLEMVETAAILRHATARSLVIMDEIGRGTTLHSGLSIAYATLDHILSKIKCRTLFATHYHEVADMLAVEKGVRDGVEFWCTDVDELDGAFSYQYRLHRGINHKSHAIKAARLAGMPDTFLKTAEITLVALDKGFKPSEAVRSRLSQLL